MSISYAQECTTHHAIDEQFHHVSRWGPAQPKKGGVKKRAYNLWSQNESPEGIVRPVNFLVSTKKKKKKKTACNTIGQMPLRARRAKPTLPGFFRTSKWPIHCRRLFDVHEFLKLPS